ncbi:hypothetical protein PQR46_11780 [Paraburkholderia sediminicola]|uniref:hypothetical protein n=1 Tax=Paraburkholderia sediminicola TaxID=458836 RepID=UPI0038BD557D
MAFNINNFSAMSVLFFAVFACAETLLRRPKQALSRSNTVTIVFALVTGSIALEFFTRILPPFRPYAFADDWVFALPLKFTSVREWVTWAFAEHVDHRIPIQKFSTFLILRASGFDFRYVVAVNYLMGIGITAMLLYVASVYRGRLRAGDLIIPFAVLNYGVGYSQWGFQFQFVSSVFFMSLFVFLTVRYTRSEKNCYLIGAAIALLADSLCGMNGLLFATVSTVAMLVWLAFPRATPRNAPALGAFAVVLLIDVVIWLAWTPSAASAVGAFDIREFIRYMYSLIPSAMGVFSFKHISWKFLTITVFLVAALAICLRQLKNRALTLQDFVLALAALTSLLVMLSVAVGRSKAQGEWNVGIAMHYGFMSVFMPVCSWIIVSKWIPERVSAGIGMLLAVVFYLAFVDNADWRYGVVNSSAQQQEEIIKAMQSGTDAKVLADTYVKNFTVDSPQNRSDVANGITAFRTAGATLYGGK